MTLLTTSHESLRDQQTRSLAPGSANVIKSLAGRVRFLAEMLQGRSIASGEAATVPRNGQGLHGVDLSGPPFGPCPIYPLFWVGGIKKNTTQWTGQRGNHIAFSDLNSHDLPVSLMNRGHAPSRRAPLSRGYPSFIVVRTTAGVSADITVRCDQAMGENDGLSQTFTLAANTNEQTFTASTAHFRLVPGRNKNMAMHFSTTATTNVLLVAAAIWPTAKLSY